jgi:hypothetical protein
VAFDQRPEDIAPYTEGITFPILLDREQTLTETYAITNIPTVVWIDEDDRIVRPNTVAFGTNLVKEFTGVEAAHHLDAVRRWVREGVVDLDADEARAAVADLTPDQEAARLRFRIGAHLRRSGQEEAAARQLALATELAPDDFTVWRAAMPLMGDDPFGEGFFEHLTGWLERGMSYNGLPAMGQPD